MSNLAAMCSMCKEPIEGTPYWSDTWNGYVCQECAECCRDAQKQIRYYGKRAGIVGELKEDKP